MNQSVEMRQIINLVKKEWLLLLLTIAFITGIGAVISFLMPKEYEAQADLLVNFSSGNVEEGITTGEIETNLQLIETYKYILSSTKIMEAVLTETGLKIKPTELVRRIKINSSVGSQIITIKANASSPEEAVLLVNSIAHIFKKEISFLMGVNNINVLTEAKIEEFSHPIKPRILLNIILSFFLGSMIALLTIYLKETYFSKLDSQEKIEKLFNTPLLGIIPEIKVKSKFKDGKTFINNRLQKTIPKLNNHDPVVESYRALRTNIQYMMNQKKIKSIFITSSNPEEGKSLTVANLAISMAMDRMKTIYIDLDLRKGVGRQFFEIPARCGMTNFLEGHASFLDIIHYSNIPDLSFISTGPIPPNPAELISSQRFTQLLEKLNVEYDVILIDCPPLLVNDAVVLATRVDGCLFIINARKTKPEQAKRSVMQLQTVNTNIIGMVLNEGKVQEVGWYYY